MIFTPRSWAYGRGSASLPINAFIFNHPKSTKPGDLVSLQGYNFGASPAVYMRVGSVDTALTLVNKVGTTVVTVTIPSVSTGPLTLRVSNGTGTTAYVTLNQAWPIHLDCTGIAPGGAFRVFGRSLRLSGYTPLVYANGVACTVAGGSDENILSCTAPSTLTSPVTITVDNGSGSGPQALDRGTVGVYTEGTPGATPFGIGVGWEQCFSPFASNVVTPTLAANGTTDDLAAINAAITTAAGAGGGVVQLPTSATIRITGSINLTSNVVLQGHGIGSTVLLFEGNYPVYAQSFDRCGLRNLTLARNGSSVESIEWKTNTRSFIQNVALNISASNQAYMGGNTDFAIVGSTFNQTGAINEQGPINTTPTQGLIFAGNTVNWMQGAPTFQRSSDSVMSGNTFTRDASYQNAAGTVHGNVIDFCYRFAHFSNTFNVVNGPITNTTRNDGETILTEGGGANRTENIGTVTSATATTLTDSANTFNTDPFSEGTIPPNYAVLITGGTGAGQARYVTGHSGTTLTLDKPWDVIPDTTSLYTTTVWSLEKTMIRGNSITDMPRGIWIYQSNSREVDVIGNTHHNAGGIYLRAYDDPAGTLKNSQWGMRVAGNTLTDSTGLWMSYINAIAVYNTATASRGAGFLNLEVRGNSQTGFVPEPTSSTEEYAVGDHTTVETRFEGGTYAAPADSMQPIQGTVIQAGSVTNPAYAITLGTGDIGTTIQGMTLAGGTALLQDASSESGAPASIGTVSL